MMHGIPSLSSSSLLLHQAHLGLLTCLNMFSGIERYRTMKKVVCTRALSASGATPASQNDIKVFLGKGKPRVSYQEPEIDKAYR